MLLNFLFSLLLFINPVNAHAPETRQVTITKSQAESMSEADFYAKAIELGDPTEQSLALYGNIQKPGELTLYTFTASKDGEIPVEVLVPVRDRNKYFRPSYFILSPTIINKIDDQLDIPVPENYGIKVVNVQAEDRKIVYEPYSLERLYTGRSLDIAVKENTKYFIGVFEPNNFTGDYSLAVGLAENFDNVSKIDLAKNIFKIKLGLVGNTQVFWGRFLGTFLMLAGLIVGLGAVTVIDLHGFLGRHDPYWFKATISAHKVTKPLIWLGTFMLAAGGLIINWYSWFTGVALFQLILLLIMVLNGAYLSFVVSPKLIKLEKTSAKSLNKSLQRRITVSFLVSFTTWWLQVALFVWNVTVLN